MSSNEGGLLNIWPWRESHMSFKPKTQRFDLPWGSELALYLQVGHFGVLPGCGLRTLVGQPLMGTLWVWRCGWSVLGIVC